MSQGLTGGDVQRRRFNCIASLVDDSGNILNSESDLFATASSYFSGLFTTNGSSSVPEILDNISPVISQSMNDSLMRPFSKDEGASIIRDILALYSSCSGQLINFDKSGVFFSSNVSDFNRSEVCRILGVHSTVGVRACYLWGEESDRATPFFSAVMLATVVPITGELTPTAGTSLVCGTPCDRRDHVTFLQQQQMYKIFVTEDISFSWFIIGYGCVTDVTESVVIYCCKPVSRSGDNRTNFRELSTPDPKAWFVALLGLAIDGTMLLSFSNGKFEFLALTNVEFVASGEYHTCGVSASGDLFTWGDGTHNAGILGHGTDMSHWIPKRVSGAIEGQQVLSVACGTWHSALATSDGKLFTFGDGKFGVLGHGDRENVMYPKEVQMLSGLKTVKVACGVWHTAAIVEVMCQSGANKSSRKLFTWGDGDKHRLGHGSKETYLLPTCVSSLIDYNFHQIACGQTITVALTTSGHVFTMGGTAYGQLGNPNSDGKLPCLVQEKLVGVEEISCGAYHVAVLTSRSEVFTWGRGANGRLGHGDIEDRKTPTLVEALRDMHVKNISCGLNFTSSICIHKWVSGPDQSVCAGCWQAFGFTKKRHNCYNCGMVHCHACSSKKAVKAALAQTPGKPHRVCDSCYAKLKAAEACNTSTV
ncbi:hypothetical protein V6N13_040993 [Hibiscus sabdariffa]